MTTQTRVLHVLSALDPGGAEMRTLEVQERLLDEGVVFDYVLLSGRPGSLAPRAISLGSQLYPLALDARFPYRFSSLLRRGDYRVVHSHVATFSGAILTLARWSGVPGRVVHFRSDGDAHGDGLRRRIQRTLLRQLITRQATDILGVSPGALSLGYRTDWSQDPRAQVVPNGIPPGPKRRTGRRSSSVSLVNIGRPMATKRRAFLGPVIDTLRERGLTPDLSCVGPTGEDTDALAAHASEHGWAAQLHLLGTRNDVRELMTSADIAVFPSILEGLPGSVLESLATGIPVVATDIPGTRFVADNVPGCTLVEATSGPDAWADAVEAILSNYPIADTIAEAFDASCFSLESAARTFKGIYDCHF